MMFSKFESETLLLEEKKNATKINFKCASLELLIYAGILPDQ